MGIFSHFFHPQGSTDGMLILLKFFARSTSPLANAPKPQAFRHEFSRINRIRRRLRGSSLPLCPLLHAPRSLPGASRRQHLFDPADGAVDGEAGGAALQGFDAFGRSHFVHGEHDDGVAEDGPHLGIGLGKPLLDQVQIFGRPAASGMRLILDHIFQNYHKSAEFVKRS
jgi:hypothetical protein